MISKNTLPEDTQKYLNELLLKSPDDLKSDEMDFLKSRIDYLTKAEIAGIPTLIEVAPVKWKKRK